MCETCLVHLMGFYIGFHFQTPSLDVTFFPSARPLKLVCNLAPNCFHLEFGGKIQFQIRLNCFGKNLMSCFWSWLVYQANMGFGLCVWKTLPITLISLWSPTLSLINLLLIIQYWCSPSHRFPGFMFRAYENVMNSLDEQKHISFINIFLSFLIFLSCNT